MTCVIVEDDPQATNLLRTMIEEYAKHLQILATAEDVEDAEKVIRKFKPELVFTDVLLKGENCFTLLERIRDLSFKIIFTSGHERFAYHAFQYNALHYLLKPLEVVKFKEAVKRIEKSQPNSSHEDVTAFLESFNVNAHKKVALPTRNGMMLIAEKEIAYCKGSGSYTEIYMLNGNCHIISKSIGQVDENLTESSFCRVHKRYIINVAEVAYIENGRPMVIYITNGEFVHLSPSYKESLFKKLNHKVNFF